jgi:hypothetical protein
MDIGVNSLGPKFLLRPIYSLNFVVSLVLEHGVNPPVCKVDAPSLVTSRSHTHILNGVWFYVAPRTYTKKTIVSKKKNRIMCSKYNNHFERNGQHCWEICNDHLKNTRIFTLIINKIFT